MSLRDQRVVPPRLHIIAAKEAPVAVIIRRQPSKLYHIMKWNLEDDSIEHGSWFKGKLFVERCDISWDGRYFSYAAQGLFQKAYSSWIGICELPFLKTLVEWDSCGGYGGSAIWASRDLILKDEDSSIRFMSSWRPTIETIGANSCSLDNVLGRRGFKRITEDGIWLDDPRFESMLRRLGKGKWFWSYEMNGLNLIMDRSTNRTRFLLQGYPDVLGKQAESATWSNSGDLLFSSNGFVHRLSPLDVQLSSKGKSIDLNDIQPPWKDQDLERVNQP